MALPSHVNAVIGFHQQPVLAVFMIKPNAFARAIEILKALVNQTGADIIFHEGKRLSEKEVLDFYNKDDAWKTKYGGILLAQEKLHEQEYVLTEKEKLHAGNGIMHRIVEFMTSGPVVVSVVEGPLDIMKTVVGSTDPNKAESFTLRHIFSEGESLEKANSEFRAVRNSIHISDSLEEARREARILFKGQQWENIEFRVPHV